MMKKIYIIGAGGHTRSLLNILNKKKYSAAGIFDDNYKPDSKEYISEVKLIGKISDIKPGYNLVLSIGDNGRRKRLFINYYKQLLKTNIIHPKATIESKVKIGVCNQIFANTVINSHVKIGDNNIINTASIIEHESVIASHNHISVGAIICGRVMIGNGCFIGAGAVIIDKINMCDNVTIGANAVVIDSIDRPGTYVGNPARRIK